MKTHLVCITITLVIAVPVQAKAKLEPVGATKTNLKNSLDAKTALAKAETLKLFEEFLGWKEKRQVEQKKKTEEEKQKEKFKASLVKSLNEYFKSRHLRNDYKISISLFDSDPNEQMYAYPSHYAWVILRVPNGTVLTKGAVRVAELNGGNRLWITRYMSHEEIIQNTGEVELLFPQKLATKIIARARN